MKHRGNEKEVNVGRRISLASVLLVVAVVAVAFVNFGIGSRFEAIQTEVRQMRSAAALLSVVEPTKVAIVGKPRVRFDDLYYEVFIPENGRFEICGSGGRNKTAILELPRVIAPLSAGRHSVDVSAQSVSENKSAILVTIDGRPSIYLPTGPGEYFRNDSLDATLRFRTRTSFEAGQEIILLDKEPKLMPTLENLRIWIQISDVD